MDIPESWEQIINDSNRVIVIGDINCKEVKWKRFESEEDRHA